MRSFESRRSNETKPASPAICNDLQRFSLRLAVVSTEQSRWQGGFEGGGAELSSPGGERGDRKGDVLLEVHDLEVKFGGRDGTGAEVTVLDGVSFELAAGEVLGVLGESGGGKSTLGLAIPGLLPGSGRIVRGRVCLRGRDLTRLAEDELRPIRGEEIALVHQEPGIALSPCLRVGQQIDEVFRAHRPWRRGRRREAILESLGQVGFDDPGAIASAYPHQLSGGQRQRVVIAQALACEPALVIADEPTAALDATSRAAIVELLTAGCRRLGSGLLFISHDVVLLASIADSLLVVYGGQIVESGTSAGVVGSPLHPYTQGLLHCAPGVGALDSEGHLPVIPGTPADPTRRPPACRFEPRCPDRREICRSLGPDVVRVEGASVRCHNHAP